MQIKILDDQNEEEAGDREQTKGDQTGNNDRVAQDGMDETDRQPIQLPLWECSEMLKFIPRKQTNNASLACCAFKKLCWSRLHGKKIIPYMVHSLCLKERNEENGQTTAILFIHKPKLGADEIPFATVTQLLDCIQHFNQIYITYLDPVVLQFVRNIRPRLDPIELYIQNNTTLDALRNLLNALTGCYALTLDGSGSPISFMELHYNFPGLLGNVTELHVKLDHREEWLVMKELILAKVAADKPFKYYDDGANWVGVGPALIDNIKQAFQNAIHQQSGNSMFLWSNDEELNEFRLENARTGEVLILFCDAAPTYQLYRCPIGEEEEWSDKGIKVDDALRPLYLVLD